MPDQPDTAGGALVQALAPDQYAAYADRVAEPKAAAARLSIFTYTDADGDVLAIGAPAGGASGTPSVSIYTPTGEPAHVPHADVPAVIDALGQAAGITPAADPWPTIVRLTAWLDARNGHVTPAEIALRLLKVTEEAGEAAQAWIGVTGQNPRKGVTHTTTDVADELCDVITAAMVALTTLTTDPTGQFARKVAQIAALRLDDTAGGAS
jgi:NTP pyrophosphatase (non-canonical NTP hydrolase)